MRLLAFSDWRTQNIGDALAFARGLNPPADLILYAGDDVARFAEGGVNCLTELSKFATQEKVLAVIGNDDWPDVGTVLEAPGVHNLHNAPYTSGDYVFLGVEASTSGPAIVSHTEREVAQHLRRQHKTAGQKALIVLSHTPPFGALDRGIRFARLDGGPHHIGSTALRRFVESRVPALVICGHCHSYGGRSERIGHTLVLNVSSHDDRGAVGNFAVLDIADRIDAKWHTTRELSGPSGLVNLHGIGPLRCTKLARAGIRTTEELTQMQDLPSVSTRSGLSLRMLRRLQLTAMSRLSNTILRIRELVPPKQDATFLDIETDLSCKRVWLIGVLRNEKFRRFYADNWKDEKPMLESFLRHLSRSSTAMLVSYSGTSFDRNVLRRALARTGLDHSRFTSFPHVDLCQEIRRHFILPTSGYGLKEVAVRAGYAFTHPELDGFAVAHAYEEHLRRRHPLDTAFFEYNEDDVRALPFLIHHLTTSAGSIADAQL